LARNSGHIKRRTAALVAVMRRAAQAEAEIGDLWQAFEDQFRENQRLVAQSVAAKGRLRDELEAAEAAEIIGLLNHPFVYYLAVVEHGWSEERFQRWLVNALIHQLLR
jgi:hypothetical protein